MSVKGFWYLAAADLYIRSCIIADWFFFSFFFCLIHEVIQQCATLPAFYLFIWYFTLAKGGSRMFSCFTLAEGCSECFLLYACWRMQRMFVTVRLLKDAANVCYCTLAEGCSECLLLYTCWRMQQNGYCFALTKGCSKMFIVLHLSNGCSKMFVILHSPKEAAECLLLYTCQKMQQNVCCFTLLKDAAECSLFYTSQRLQQNVCCFTLLKAALECLLFYTSKGCSRMFIVLHF